MNKTLNHYKKRLKLRLVDLATTTTKLSELHPDKLSDAIKSKENRENSLRTLFASRRKDKFTRDTLDEAKSQKYSQTYMQYLIDGKPIPTAAELLRLELLSSVEIPPFDPINLDQHHR